MRDPKERLCDILEAILLSSDTWIVISLPLKGMSYCRSGFCDISRS